MVRTKANSACTRKAVAAKAPRKSLGGVVRHSSSPSSHSSGKRKSSGNPVKIQPIPAWQKGIDMFLNGSGSRSGSSLSQDTAGSSSLSKETQVTTKSKLERRNSKLDDINSEGENKESEEEEMEKNSETEEAKETEEEMEESEEEVKESEEEVEESEEEVDDVIEEEYETDEDEEEGNTSVIDALPKDLITLGSDEEDN